MFKKTRVLSGREARRFGERERRREQRQEDVKRFWALTPEERKARMDADEQFRRISKNGITLEDVKRAEDEAYDQGVKVGIENTMRTCYAAICLALHEKHGFGKSRCKDVLNRVDEIITMSLTSQEAIEQVYEDIGLEIQFKEMPGDRVQEVGA